MNFVFSKRAKLVSYILIIIGVISVIAGYFIYGEDHHSRWWTNLMINGFYFFAIGLGALFFYILSFATETSWTVMLRRVMEGIFSYLPVGAIVLVIVFLGSSFHWNHIYHWMDEAVTSEFVSTSTAESAHPEYYDSMEVAKNAGVDIVANPEYDELLDHKSPYLNIPFFWLRTIIYLATFLLFARWYRKRSLREDEEGGTALHFKGYRRSAVFLALFAFFSTTMAWDWIMSIDAHWWSSLFGWYVFSGIWVSALNIITIITLYLISKGYLKDINSSHIQDMGKWVFAVSFLWSYLWFAQFLLIWYADIPEEVTYFFTRIENYKVMYFGMFIINFALPMVALMSRDAKRNPGFLIAVGTIIFIGHYLDTFLLIVPGVMHEAGKFGLLEIGFLLGFIGLFMNRVMNTMTKAPLEPQKSPFLEESLHHSI